MKYLHRLVFTVRNALHAMTMGTSSENPVIIGASSSSSPEKQTQSAVMLLSAFRGARLNRLPELVTKLPENQCLVASLVLLPGRSVCLIQVLTDSC